MATSTIKIYKTVLTPSRNALVDDLDEYLNTEATLTYEDSSFQYQKLGLDIDIKINITQDVISNYNLGNYVVIAQDGKKWYYFIMNTEWKGTKTVNLKLSIDSINTFRNDLTFTDRTTIQRQHGNRLLNPTNSNYFIRLVDRISEQIPATKELTGQSVINKSNQNFDWYLIYKTRDELTPDNPNNPIHCYTIASKSIVISKTGGGASRTLTPTDLPEGQYNYVLRSDNLSGKVTLSCYAGYSQSTKWDISSRDLIIDSEYTVATPTTVNTEYGPAPTGYDIAVYRLKNFKFVNAGNNRIDLILDGDFVRNEGHQGSQLNPVFSISSGFVVVSNMPVNAGSDLTLQELNFTRITNDGSIPFQYAQTLITDTMVYNIGTQVTRSTVAFSSVDKTDSKIIKIIKLPYAPCNVTYSNGVYNFPSEWQYESGYMRLNDASLSTEFLNENIEKIPVKELFVQKPATISPTALNNLNYESKLFHSDFYTFKLVYDSFAKEIQLERYETGLADENYAWTPNDVGIWFHFKPTNTINSKFAFRFDTYLTDDSGNTDFASYHENTDYEKYLLISRNNEETVFSNDYLNYIRTGYNYDKKSKEEQLNKSWLLGGLQLAAGVASFAVSAYTGGVSAAAGISLVSGAIAMFASNTYTQVSNERSMQAKLASLAAQSSNVAGADDVDLLSFYNKNRLTVIKYGPIEEQRKALGRMFYLCGYKRDIIDTPNTTSRYWFNFIQCKPVFNEEGITPYNDYIQDVKSRYESGVTVYHHHAGVGTGWDWQQQYENWETYLLN